MSFSCIQPLIFNYLTFNLPSIQPFLCHLLCRTYFLLAPFPINSHTQTTALCKGIISSISGHIWGKLSSIKQYVQAFGNADLIWLWTYAGLIAYSPLLLFPNPTRLPLLFPFVKLQALWNRDWYYFISCEVPPCTPMVQLDDDVKARLRCVEHYSRSPERAEQQHPRARDAPPIICSLHSRIQTNICRS